MSDEAQLIDRARAGSVTAFTDLVRRYQDRLLRFLVTRCASFADAEDALQDTFINAFRYIGSYDPRWRFSTWLYRIALRNAAKLHTPATVGLDEAGNIGEDGNDPLAECIAASDRENLWLSARRLLSDELYTAMWLRYAEDMSIRDVASVLDRSTSWTKVNLMRGRKALDAELSRDRARENEAYG